ncbi:MAG: hypothetical protein ABI605_20440 [Rhizobacter sp.]
MNLARNIGLAACISVSALAAEPPGHAEALSQRHARLAPELASSVFGRPLALSSVEVSGGLQGSIDAVVAQPFALAREHLQQPQAWCEILMLHINTKQCTVAGNALAVHIGRKHDQPLRDSYLVRFTLQPPEATADYLGIRLSAENGPFGTHDYRIQLQAVPLDGGHKTFMHLDYAYGYGMAAKLAMQGYLATVGSGKLGFTREGPSAESPYIGGVRGAVERNTMRYYLAIDAYLASLAAAPAQQRAQRLETWFAATEQYATQLHELGHDEYLAMKNREFSRPGG